MKSINRLGSAFVLFLIFANFVFADLTPSDLRCEYQKEPLEIDTPEPRLSWVLQSRQQTGNCRQPEVGLRLVSLGSWNR